ncbi:MAG TPA: hypothetical protein VFX70_11715 [Mycobacteriales bacterium]|nr:hypothetical protein [Mycobacteriales bacterium]
MTVHTESPVAPRAYSAGPDATAPAPARFVWALTRIGLGWIFLWAFLDKTLGLGHDTTHGAAWIRGGSPAKGFLAFATTGPFADAYQGLAGDAWVDWLFMLGLLGVGAALLAGVGVRVAAVAGAAMMLLMWGGVLPPANNPFADDHLIYALVLIGLALVRAGDTLGLGARWARTGLVERHPWLR